MSHYYFHFFELKQILISACLSPSFLLFTVYHTTKKEANYFASSVALTSRMTVTLIVPGYCISSSILFLISRATL